MCPAKVAEAHHTGCGVFSEQASLPSVEQTANYRCCGVSAAEERRRGFSFIASGDPRDLAAAVDPRGGGGLARTPTTFCVSPYSASYSSSILNTRNAAEAIAARLDIPRPSQASGATAMLLGAVRSTSLECQGTRHNAVLGLQ